MITASICTIGDEILIGQIVDTNSSAIARELQTIGIKVRWMLSIGDDRKEILENLQKCLDETDIVVVTGGLGPTRDDITKDALRELSRSAGYREDATQMEINRRILEARHITMLDSNRAQALVPERCEVLPNDLGTAPGMCFTGLGKSGKSVLYSLPGVPFEALGLLPKVIESIRSKFQLEEISHRTILTFGIPESELAEQIRDWEDTLPASMHLAYLPNPTLGVRLRLTQVGGHHTDFEPQVTELKRLLGNAVYGEGEDSLQHHIGQLLLKQGKTVSAAESCTGGRISALFTSVSGCSAYYMGSVTSYANEVKMGVLGVKEETLRKHGAVSEETVIEMARGVLLKLNTDYSVVSSGIAGPGGGTPTKPVGMAWLATAYRNPAGEISVTTRKVQFRSSREINIERFASHALNLLRLKILENE